MMQLKETAASGSTGASSIATTPGGTGREIRKNRRAEAEWRSNVSAEKKDGPSDKNLKLSPEARKNLEAAKAKLKAKKSLKGFIKDKVSRLMRISEAVDMNDIMSRLKSAQNSSPENTVSYGIEDDDGNTMRVTVRSDQAEAFEKKISEELADIVSMNQKGFNQFKESKRNISIAELLYNMKDEFEFVDIAFPRIPTDGVYNADKVSYGVKDTAQQALSDINPDDEFSEEDIDSDLNDDEFGDEDLDGGSEDFDDSDLDDEASGEVEDLDDISSDLEDVDTGSNEKDMMSKILDMLKADAEAKIEQAKAEAEKAKALQAEYAAKAANATVKQQEELMRMEAEIEQQKQKQKEAKKLADLAKFRAQQSNVSEGHVSISQILKEFDEYDTTQTLSKQLAMLRSKYAPQPGDTPEQIAEKRADMTSARKELMARLERVRRKEAKGRNNSRQNNQTNNQNQQQNVQQNANNMNIQNLARR